jgi:hypothetical protein
MQRANNYRMQKAKESMLPPPVQPGMPTFGVDPYSQLQRKASVFNGTSGARTDAMGNLIQPQQQQQPAWGQLPPGMEPQQQGGGGGGYSGMNPMAGMDRNGGRPHTEVQQPQDPFQALNDFQNAQPWKPGGVPWGTQADGSVAGIPNPGFSDDDLPTKAARGGQFMPGQSAIVGDNPDGRPNKTQEMVTALPGGGFQVTPNPKTAAMMPHFAFGGGLDVPPMSDATARLTEQQRPDQGEIEPGAWTTPMQVPSTRQTLNAPAPTAAETEIKRLQGLNGPGPIERGYNAVTGALGDAWNWTQAPGEALGASFHDWLHGSEAQKNAPGQIARLKQFPNEAPGAVPVGTAGTPGMLSNNQDAPNATLDQFGAQFMKGSQAPWLLPSQLGNTPYAPLPAPDSPALAAAIANMKTLAEQTNARLGRNAVDPVLAEQQLRANPPQFMPGGPPVQSSNGGSFGQTLPTLSPGTATSPVRPSFNPLGLEGRELQEWTRQHNPDTMAGNAAIIGMKQGLFGANAAYQRQLGLHNLESRNTFRNEQGIQDRKDQRMIFGINSKQLFAAGNKKPAPPPQGLVPVEGADGLFIAHDGNGKATYMQHDENGHIVPFGYKPTPTKKDVSHLQIKEVDGPNGKEHHIIDPTTGTFTVAKQIQPGASGIKSVTQVH